MLQRIEFAWHNFMAKRDRSKGYRRSSFKGIKLLALTVIIVLLLILFMVFKTTEGEQNDLILEEYLVDVTDYNVAKGDFQAIIEKAQKEIKTEAPPPNDYSGVPIGSVSINPSVPANIKELNLQAYRVAAKYYNSSTVKYIPPEVADPLFFLALSNVEHEGYVDTTRMWSAAVPSKFISDLTPDIISNFGIQDTVTKYPDYWKMKRTSSMTYQGPLQMGIYYGVREAMIPSDLKGSEYTRAGDIIHRVLPISGRDKLVAAPGAVTGDRLNWGDAVNRGAGYLDKNFATYLKRDGITRTGEFSLQNRYSYVAVLAMTHNTGVSVIQSVDGKNVSPWWSNISNARKLAHYLGNQDVLDEIKAMADANVSNYRNGGTLRATCNTREADKILRSIIAKGYMTENEIYSNHAEKRNFPIKVLFSYLTLENLYTGG